MTWKGKASHNGSQNQSFNKAFLIQKKGSPNPKKAWKLFFVTKVKTLRRDLLNSQHALIQEKYTLQYLWNGKKQKQWNTCKIQTMLYAATTCLLLKEKMLRHASQTPVGGVVVSVTLSRNSENYSWFSSISSVKYLNCHDIICSALILACY